MPERRKAELMTLRKPLDWRDCEFVSMANAARIAGRAPGWAQELVTFGSLEARRLPCGGPPVITTASLARFLDAAEPIHRVRPVNGRRPALRVVT